MIITPEFCKQRLEELVPDLSVVSIKDYKTDFLVTYMYKNKDNIPDPFLLVSKRNGNIKAYTIAEDPEKYYSTPDIFIKK